ncbi:hypothetical protein [Streptomyces laurentii]|uniref:hypothetical protein n=1 Tax=Streptomyces laurentii TaxID=39478 RepID=UPI0036B7ED54
MAVDDFFSSLNPLAAFNLNTATSSGPSAAGAGLPATSTSSNDGGDKPWHPDSPIFWVAMIGIASFVGIVGASVNLHAGPARAGASIGK